MYRRILIGIDDGAASAAALAEAVRLACEQHAVLNVVHVVDVHDAYWCTDDFARAVETERARKVRGRSVLDRLYRQAADCGVTVESTLITAAGQSVGEALVEAGVRWHADLIVTGGSGRSGLGRMLFGSVADGVRRFSPVPVLVVAPQA